MRHLQHIIMNNRKLYFWLGGLAILLLLIYSFYLAFGESQKPPSTPPDKIIIETKILPVEVNNFLNAPLEKLSYGAVLAETAEYKIIFFSKDEGFIITLKQKPLSTAQTLAESEFLKQLGVDQTQACLLKAYILVPRDVDETAAGSDYPLSFCDGGKHF